MIPVQYQKRLQDIREQEAARVIARFVREGSTILNIGPSWGRDHYFLSAKGKTVINLDIAPQRHLCPLLLGDITKGIPFPSKSFHVVIMAEVLEHLIEDGNALSEARRVLRDDGRLVISVPFYNDQPDYHVRIYSPRTIRRLLGASGFQVDTYWERGGLISFPRAVHLIRRIVARVVKHDRFNAFIVSCDGLIAHRLPFLLRMSPAFGCYIMAKKSNYNNHRQINVNEFQHC